MGPTCFDMSSSLVAFTLSLAAARHVASNGIFRHIRCKYTQASCTEGTKAGNHSDSAAQDTVAKKSKPVRVNTVWRLLRRLQQRRCDVTPAEAQQAARCSRALLLHCHARLHLVSAAVLQVLASFQKSQQWQHAIHVLRSLQCADSINYGAVLNACARCSRWVAASALALNLKQLGLEANAILQNTLIDSFAPLSAWERPLEKLMAMRQQGIRYNRASFGSAFAGSSWQQVMAMLRLATGLDLRPDVITLGSALNSLSESWTMCLRFLLRMRSSASRPNNVCLTSAMGSCENWQRALAISRLSAFWCRLCQDMSASCFRWICDACPETVYWLQGFSVF